MSLRQACVAVLKVAAAVTVYSDTRRRANQAKAAAAAMLRPRATSVVAREHWLMIALSWSSVTAYFALGGSENRFTDCSASAKGRNVVGLPLVRVRDGLSAGSGLS